MISDLVLKGAGVIDAARGIDRVTDVALGISPPQVVACTTLNTATGCVSGITLADLPFISA